MPATAALLTSSEAQRRIGRSPTRFRQYVAAGRLPFTTDARGWRRFAAADVDRLTAEVARYSEDSATDSAASSTAETRAPAPVTNNADQSDLQSFAVQFLRDAERRASERT